MKDNQSSLLTNQDDILIFIDETGHEGLQQPNYPVFGYGGVSILSRDYGKILADPWRALKTSFGVNSQTPLHGSNFKFGKKEMEEFSSFFQK